MYWACLSACSSEIRRPFILVLTERPVPGEEVIGEDLKGHPLFGDDVAGIHVVLGPSHDSLKVLLLAGVEEAGGLGSTELAVHSTELYVEDVTLGLGSGMDGKALVFADHLTF